MKLLLTSAGITNKSIEKAFLKLVGKPAKDIKVAFIPTAANPMIGDKRGMINDLVKLKDMDMQVDIVDFAALTFEMVKERLREADVLFVEGGSSSYLLDRVRALGVVGLIKELLVSKVWVGASAGCMILEQNLFASGDLYGKNIVKLKDTKALGVIDFKIFPHLNSKEFPNVTLENINKLLPKLKKPLYALDDNSAIVVDGDKIKVVSEGEWERFEV